MTLDDIIRSIRTLKDVPRLFQALGATPRWEPVPPSFWGENRAALTSLDRTALIARTGALDWYGCETRDPPAVSRILARRLLRHGIPAGVVCLDRRRGQLALSVAFTEAPVLALSPGETDRVTIALLHRLGTIALGGALATAARVAEILAGEGVGKRFFRSFGLALDRMSDGITGVRRPADRRPLALLQLTRVLLLYFVQSRGWLDGQTGFLRARLDDCLARGRRVHRDLLRPLFFGTLNQPAGARSRLARSFGRIPFLNGGLFEPHRLERSWTGSIPNRLWRDVFDGLFERFEFTVREGMPGPAIAPDMLGRVFEGLMHAGERHRTGTFYTPPALVDTLVGAGIAALVSSREECSFEAARERLDRADPGLLPLLRAITVLDPAVGSGAFLLGTMETLVALRRRMAPGESDLRRSILSRNLFGVDLNPTAVQLTELRLWLAVVSDDPEDVEQVRPLPNLDSQIRQGDSLHDPLGALAGLVLRPQLAGPALGRLRRRFATVSGREKARTAHRLRELEQAAVRECLDQVEAALDRRIRQWLAAARDPDLFGDTRKPDRGARTRLRALRESRRQVRGARRRLQRDGTVPWFQYEAHFGEIFAAGGFELVTGNPPWVRAEDLTPAERDRLGRRYAWWRTDHGRGFRHQPDLAIAFLQRATELAAPGGAVALLMPAKLATAGYAAPARRALVAEHTLHVAADLTRTGAAQFQATAYPMAVVSSRRAPHRQNRVRTSLDEDQSTPQRLLTQGPWMLRGDTLARALSRMSEGHACVGDHFGIHLGIKTGANDVFLDPPAGIEPDLIRPALRGRDIRPFVIRPGSRILWTHDDQGLPLRSLPPAARAYLTSRRGRLERRSDLNGEAWWTLFRIPGSTPSPRVVWRDLAARLEAAALLGPDTRPIVPLNTCYVIILEQETVAARIAAWLNCTWVRAAAIAGADPARGGYARFNAAVVAALPLPGGVLEDDALSEFCRSSAPRTQDDLDELTARHLDLDPHSRRALARAGRSGPGHRRGSARTGG
ncbi:MAG: N-6 DNA methylase [Gemmatimonadales bacterium]